MVTELKRAEQRSQNTERVRTEWAGHCNRAAVVRAIQRTCGRACAQLPSYRTASYSAMPVQTAQNEQTVRLAGGNPSLESFERPGIAATGIGKQPARIGGPVRSNAGRKGRDSKDHPSQRGRATSKTGRTAGRRSAMIRTSPDGGCIYHSAASRAGNGAEERRCHINIAAYPKPPQALPSTRASSLTDGRAQALPGKLRSHASYSRPPNRQCHCAEFRDYRVMGAYGTHVCQPWRSPGKPNRRTALRYGMLRFGAVRCSALQPVLGPISGSRASSPAHRSLPGQAGMH